MAYIKYYSLYISHPKVLMPLQAKDTLGSLLLWLISALILISASVKNLRYSNPGLKELIFCFLSSLTYCNLRHILYVHIQLSSSIYIIVFCKLKNIGQLYSYPINVILKYTHYIFLIRYGPPNCSHTQL